MSLVGYVILSEISVSLSFRLFSDLMIGVCRARVRDQTKLSNFCVCMFFDDVNLVGLGGEFRYLREKSNFVISHSIYYYETGRPLSQSGVGIFKVGKNLELP